MKHLISISLIVLLFACKAKEKKTNENKTASKETLKDRSLQKKRLYSLLSMPIKLDEFKIDKKVTTGIAQKRPYQYGATSERILYQYNFITSPYEQRDFELVEITVLKSLELPHTYDDPGQELVQIDSRSKHVDLKHLNLVGQTIEEVENTYGKLNKSKKGIYFYNQKNMIVLLQFKKQKCVFIRYLRMNSAAENIEKVITVFREDIARSGVL